MPYTLCREFYEFLDNHRKGTRCHQRRQDVLLGEQKSDQICNHQWWTIQ